MSGDKPPPVNESAAKSQPRFVPTSVSADPAIAESPCAEVLRQRGVTIETTSAPRLSRHEEGKQHLHLSRKKGSALRRCASLDERYICCNTRVLDAVSNCPFECSYCFLQHYLTDKTLTVVADPEALLEEVRAMVTRNPSRLLRIGTWELGDSLALEHLVPTASALVEGFATVPGAVLELRTKSAQVEELLALAHGGRTVVSWTVNPAGVIEREEQGTARLEDRLAAMEKVAGHGYPIALHFDPMILYEGWEVGYERLVEALRGVLRPEQVAWVSIGSLRFNPEMKLTIERHYPESRLTCQEMVLGPDRKVRYVKPTRVEMYQRLLRHWNDAFGDQVLAYLCMERWDVWDRVFGFHPESHGHLDYLFAASLHQRFPRIVPNPPEQKHYDEPIL